MYIYVTIVKLLIIQQLLPVQQQIVKQTQSVIHLYLYQSEIIVDTPILIAIKIPKKNMSIIGIYMKIFDE